MDLNTTFGLFAGVVGVLDLAFIHFRGGSLPPQAKRLRLVGALVMFTLSALMLLKIVKLV